MSDVHCPILFHLSIPQETSNSRPESNDPEIDHNKECPNRFLTWSREITTVFRGNLNDTRIGIMESTLNYLSNNATQSGVDELCAKMNSIIIESAEESGAYKEIKRGRPRKNPQKKPWFDDECAIERKKYYKTKKNSLEGKVNAVCRIKKQEIQEIYEK